MTTMLPPPFLALVLVFFFWCISYVVLQFFHPDTMLYVRAMSQSVYLFVDPPHSDCLLLFFIQTTTLIPYC